MLTHNFTYAHTHSPKISTVGKIWYCAPCTIKAVCRHHYLKIGLSGTKCKETNYSIVTVGFDRILKSNSPIVCIYKDQSSSSAQRLHMVNALCVQPCQMNTESGHNLVLYFTTNQHLFTVT